MGTPYLSVIFPVKNLFQEIGGVLRSVIGQAGDVPMEFLIVDMGSQDKTVWESFRLLKELSVPGSVIQSGEGTVARALNAAMAKASGQYVTFIFARRLYQDFLLPYCDAAQKTGADIIFGTAGVPFGEEWEPLPGLSCLAGILEERLLVDISAILLRRDFLERARLYFSEGCEYGYSVEFLLKCLCAAESAIRSPVVLKRNTAYELHRGSQKPAGASCFQRVMACERVLDFVENRHPEERRILALLQERCLPQAVLWCVDLLLREGTRYQAVQDMLKASGCKKYLKAGRATPWEMKKRIRLWQTMPWLYRPQKA